MSKLRSSVLRLYTMLDLFVLHNVLTEYTVESVNQIGKRFCIVRVKATKVSERVFTSAMHTLIKEGITLADDDGVHLRFKVLI